MYDVFGSQVFGCVPPWPGRCSNLMDSKRRRLPDCSCCPSSLHHSSSLYSGITSDTFTFHREHIKRTCNEGLFIGLQHRLQALTDSATCRVREFQPVYLLGPSILTSTIAEPSVDKAECIVDNLASAREPNAPDTVDPAPS